MKNLYTYLFVILMSMTYERAYAHDFEIKNSDGKTIYYNFNSDGSSVTVTYQGASYSSYSDEYSGEIVIPETVTYDGKTYSVTSIGREAFRYCSSLTSVTIPNSVTSIGYKAFVGCSGLTKVIVPNFDIKNWCSIKFDENYANPLYYAHHLYSDENTEITELVIPDGVTSIGSSAFEYCIGLTSVTIPNSVTFIDNDAFDGCSRLKSVTWNAEWCKDFQCGPFDGIATQITQFIIGDNVISIPDRLCGGMSNLTSMTIGNSVSVIGMYAFYGCSRIHSITIPSSVTKIQQHAFEKMHLSTVKILRGIPPTFEFGIEAFDDYHSRLYVPYGSKAKYEAAQYWKDFNIRMLSDSNGDDVVNEIETTLVWQAI